jgi:hypothetical protein
MMAKASPIPAADEYDGQGGSYEIDPTTGVRHLVAQTQAPDRGSPPPVVAVLSSPPADVTPAPAPAVDTPTPKSTKE